VLVLARHGEATANAAGLLLGRADAGLTELGRRQAGELGRRLGPVHALVTSPLRRATDTAAALGLAVPATVDARWIEVDYGEFEGRPVGDVPAEVWRRWRRDPEFRPQGGESLGEVGRRVAEACEGLFAAPGAAARSEEGDVVVVSHVSPIKAAVAWALGGDEAMAWRLHLSTGSISRIAWGPTGPVLETFNEVPGDSPAR